MKFQVTENFGGGTYCYHYIDCEPEEGRVKALAIETVRKSYIENNRLSWFGAKPAMPTLAIAEFDDEKKRKVRNGRKFKTKWR